MIKRKILFHKKRVFNNSERKQHRRIQVKTGVVENLRKIEFDKGNIELNNKNKVHTSTVYNKNKTKK